MKKPPPPPPGRADAKWFVATWQDVGDLLGVRGDTVRKDMRREGMPIAGTPGKAGAFDLRAIARWAIERAREGTTQKTGDGSTEKRQLEVRKLRAEAEAKERENRVAGGEYLEASAVRRDIERAVATARERFLRLTDAMRTFLPAECADEVLRQMTRALRDACDEFADEMQAVPARTETPHTKRR